MNKLEIPRIMLDSGAFTAHNKGIDIDIDAYAEFINLNHDLFFHQINLDRILDRESFNLRNAKKSAEESFLNWRY